MGTIRIFSIWWFLFIFSIKWQRWCKVLCLLNCNHEKKFFWPIENAEPEKLREVKQGLRDHQKQPQKYSIKKGVLKNFAIFTGKHLCRSLFLSFKAWNFIKKRLQHRCFPLNIDKFLRKPILKDSCLRRLLDQTSRYFYRKFSKVNSVSSGR